MRIFKTLLSLGAILLFSSRSISSELMVGRTAVDITPAIGTPMLTPQRPPFEIKLATKAHDPLHVKAIVFESGGERAAIVSCDLTSIPLQHRAGSAPQYWQDDKG